MYSAAATACVFRIGQGEKNVKKEELFGIKEDKDASEREVRQVEQKSERINEIEQKITVLTKIIEERFGIKIDFRNDVEKFIDDFLDEN